MKSRISHAFLWSKILTVPFWILLNTLSLILYKEFHISPICVTILIAIKPITAVFASYWSCLFSGSNKSFMFTNCIRFFPFLFFFFFNSPWMMIFCFAFYMTLSRATTPVWGELFKKHLSQDSQHRLFAMGNACEYLGTTLCPILLGILLDYNANLWRILFPLTALFGISSTFFMKQLPNSASGSNFAKKNYQRPWKNAILAIKTGPDFRNYLLGFMLGGAGLMVIQPMIPIFLVDELQFSYTEMMVALSVCKGIGYLCASPIWVRLFKKLPIFQFSFLVALLASCFPLILLGARWNIAFCYIAYVGYGLMQSGSELSWHLSSLVFAKDKESFVFSETNILAVGVRGCVIPFFGIFLFYLFNSVTVMLVGSLFCLGGALSLIRYRQKTEVLSELT